MADVISQNNNIYAIACAFQLSFYDRYYFEGHNFITNKGK